MFDRVLHTHVHFKFFNGCLPQILLGSFLNSLTHITIRIKHEETAAFLMFPGRYGNRSVTLNDLKTLKITI